METVTLSRLVDRVPDKTHRLAAPLRAVAMRERDVRSGPASGPASI
jgi:hypothetical protein